MGKKEMVQAQFKSNGAQRKVYIKDDCKKIEEAKEIGHTMEKKAPKNYLGLLMKVWLGVILKQEKYNAQFEKNGAQRKVCKKDGYTKFSGVGIQYKVHKIGAATEIGHTTEQKAYKNN